VVETNATFSKNKVEPVNSGHLPESIYKLSLPHIENQTQVLEAALNQNKNDIYEAFAREPVAIGRGTEAELRSLADKMMKNTIREV